MRPLFHHALCCASLFCTSCSLRFSHPDGSVTYLGAVNIREAPAGELPLVHSRRIGVMADVGASSNGMAVGYDDRLVVNPPNNAITEVDYIYGGDPSVMVRSDFTNASNP